MLMLAFCVTWTGFLTGLLLWQRIGSEGSLDGVLGAGGHVSFSSVIACGLVQWLRCTVLATLTLMVSTYARSSMLAVMAGFAALVVCSLRSFAWDSVQATGPGWAGAAGMVGFLVPDFDLYDVANGVAGGGALSIGYLAGIALYSAVYVGVFAAIAGYCFRRREL